jgi:cell wall-associated NlpC family hydrolase
MLNKTIVGKILAIAALFFIATPASADGTVIIRSTDYTLTSSSVTFTADIFDFTTAENLEVKYGTTSTADDQTTGRFQIQPTDTSFSKQISGLMADTNYFFQVVNATTNVVYAGPAQYRTLTAGSVDVTNGSTTSPECQDGADGYCLLAPLGGFSRISDSQLADYFGMIFKILIGLAGVLAVIMIFYGGVQYMTTDAIGDKEEGKKRIWNAVIGLLIALGSYTILNTVNPDLLEFKFGINKVTIQYTPGDVAGPLLTTSTGLYEPSGILCNGTGGPSSVLPIVQSYLGKVTYRLGGKGQQAPSATVYYDCSGFVHRVLECAGMTTGAQGTAGIFAGAESVTTMTAGSVNGIALQPGDLLGWVSGGAESSGHVVIYVGNGQVAESHGPTDKIGRATDITTRHISSYENRIKYIKRAQ